jgi:thiol:disulfide interchange protein DsbD
LYLLCSSFVFFVPFVVNSSAAPGGDRIAFEVKAEAVSEDPFAEANKLGAKPVKVRRGEILQLTITGTPKPGFHTYPLTQRAPKQDVPGLSSITYQEVVGLKPLWPIEESKPEFVLEDIGEDARVPYLEFRQPFTWKQDILVLPDAKPGAKRLDFRIKAQVCDEHGCTWGEHPLSVDFEVTDEPAVPLSAALKERLQATPTIAVVTPPQAAPSAGVAAEAAPSTGATAEAAPAGPWAAVLDLLWFAWQGVLFGGLSLLTPCVFPMIPITVSFFIKQSEKEHHRPLTLATVYSLTIVTVLTAGGLILIPVLQPFSQHWVTNSILGILFLVFALSLFGMYDITLPSGLANLTSSQQQRGGLVGTMFMALTFTIISFTCVAPFYGSFIALTAAASSVASWAKLVFGALMFSVTFASPFFVLALFPTLLRKMPKSGSWMNTVKVVMGFVELAAALKFLRAAELRFFAGAQFFTYDLVLGMYVAIAVLCGLYLLNLYRLPHDHEPIEQLGVMRLMFSLAFLSLGLYLLPGLFKTGSGEQQRPSGAVFDWLDAFLLPDAHAPVSAGPVAGGPEGRAASGQLVWLGNLEKGLQDARDKRRLVFIDFTGLT